ncbi:MAG: glycosyltransferase [Segetibacter sp.]
MSKKSLDFDISIIIPFKDKAKMTLDCVQSLIKYSPGFKEILLVSNHSKPEELAKVSAFIKVYPNISLVEYNHSFHYQKMNNWAVRQTTGKFIMFLNNDTQLNENSTDLLKNMYKKAQEPKVGVVGCLLLYGDERTIQHAGVYLMPQGLAEHLYVGKRYRNALNGLKSIFPYSIRQDHPMTAVTGAVSLVERKKYDSVSGFDERFIICGGDVDLCIRLNKAGYQTWYVGGGYILHKESQSRINKPIPYNDFYWSYLSYSTAFDSRVGDPFLSKVTKQMKVS